MENVVETLKTLYKKRTQLVNGTLKGGFIDHEAAENKAIDIAIEALMEMSSDIVRSVAKK